MLRKHEQSESVKAGVFAVTVHLLLLGVLLISFNWKTTHPISIAEVELWDSVSVPVQPPQPMPEPKPEPELQKAPEPQPVVEPKAEPEPQVEIAIEKKAVKKPVIEKPVKKEPPKPTPAPDNKLAKLQEAMRQEALQNTAKPKPAKPADEALKKLQQDSLNEDKTAGEQKNAAAKSAASAGAIGEYRDKIRAKIRGNVNKALCGNGNPELEFGISLMPTGQLTGAPKLVKSSGNPACDDAVERAIMASEPLPLPPDATLFAQFRNLNLKFRPNE